MPTEQNPADLITRGPSNSEFEKQLDFWSHGLSFISDNLLMRLSSNLGCLADENKLLACCALEESQREPISNMDKFSDPNKLYFVTSLVFKFIGKCKRQSKCDDQYLTDAKIYWVKIRTK